MVTIQDIEDGGYLWETDNPHADNVETTNDFIENELPNDIEVYVRRGNYLQIELKDRRCFSVLVFGNGDFCHHQAEFELLW